MSVGRRLPGAEQHACEPPPAAVTPLPPDEQVVPDGVRRAVGARERVVGPGDLVGGVTMDPELERPALDTDLHARLEGRADGVEHSGAIQVGAGPEEAGVLGVEVAGGRTPGRRTTSWKRRRSKPSPSAFPAPARIRRSSIAPGVSVSDWPGRATYRSISCSISALAVALFSCMKSTASWRDHPRRCRPGSSTSRLVAQSCLARYPARSERLE